jgi:S-adenosylmethionine hydrolase
VLSLACELEGQAQVFHLTSRKYFLNPVSHTFHGRDIFSPVAAWISRGTAPDLLGERIPSLVKLDFPRVRRNGNTLIATVLHTDKFGNLITNISRQDMPTLEKHSLHFVIQLGDKTISQLRRSYADADPGEIFSIWGSSGLLEISMNQASAAEMLNVEEGQEFVIVLQLSP